MRLSSVSVRCGPWQVGCDVNYSYWRDKYTIPEVERLFNVAFAASEAELEGAEETVLLKMNMSIEEVIARKGKPKTRVELGSKTILAYDDLKLIFKDGKLVDAE